MKKRTENVRDKLRTGSSQQSLNTNRLAALRMAESLINAELGGSDDSESFTCNALQAASRQLASLMSKSEKALTKLAEGSWQHTMTLANIEATRIALALIAHKLESEPLAPL
jgi:hypothetical protein